MICKYCGENKTSTGHHCSGRKAYNYAIEKIKNLINSMPNYVIPTDDNAGLLSGIETKELLGEIEKLKEKPKSALIGEEKK